MATNIVSSMLPVIIIQLIILPSINHILGSKEYGLIITLISILSLFAAVFGNTLNNARLIVQSKDDASKYQENFLFLTCILGMFTFVCVAIVSSIYSDGSLGSLDIVGIASAAVLMFLNSYYLVAFRLSIEYKKILVSSIFLAIGLLLGLAVFNLLKLWWMAYILGYGLSFIYVFRNGGLLDDPFRITPHFLKLCKIETILVASSLLGSLMLYADRMLLYPLLGGTAVSLYFVASLAGKMLSMATGPISGVILSYLVKGGRLRRAVLRKCALILFLITVILLLLCILVSRPMLSVLYPDLVGDAMQYVPILSAVAAINSACGCVNPIVLRFCNLRWQLGLNAINVATYVLASFSLFYAFGLLGFCIGALIAASLKLLLSVGACYANKQSMLAEYEPTPNVDSKEY
ncbi:lipopolysaccharide biosynthesis protein [Eggerthella timonensis]|uniref:lipopolysaccharide biosynthesis protein n=1 Tax=Eggerthella timonensis TaxID=1871008 RepID=UPI0011AEC6C5|nr:hypothetical protein [Eggerthella timonensis]